MPITKITKIYFY